MAAPVAIPLLLGLGVKERSMTPGSMPAAKSLAGTLDIAGLRSFASESLELKSVAAVRLLVKKRLGLQQEQGYYHLTFWSAQCL